MPAPITLEEFREKVYTDKYTTLLPFNTREERAAHREDQGRLNAEFKRDLLAVLGLTKHPKADLFFQKCWDAGHSAGFSEVLIVAEDWVEILEGYPHG